MHKIPDLDLGAAANAFRDEVRDWLAAEPRWVPNNDPGVPHNHRLADRDFAAKLGARGWLSLSWPKEWGGQARSPLEQLAFEEEMAYAGAPDMYYATGATMMAPAIIKCGTPAQCEAYLPGIRSGKASYGLGYTEPESGSDLAGMRTRATRDGDDWVIQGQKIFTTSAGFATHMWLAARTDPNNKRHGGLSMFIVPMDTPGITMHPMISLSDHRSNTVFYDSVRVPASALIGELHGGWKVITTALAYERVLLASVAARARAYYDRLLAHIVADAALRVNPLVRDRLGTLACEIEAARMFAFQTALVMEQGGVPIVEAAISKVFSSELMQRVTSTAMELLGTGATLAPGETGALIDGVAQFGLRDSLLYTIGGGTNEIQRNLIAIRGLGLPR